MTFSKPTFSATTRDGSIWSLHAYRLFLAAIFLLGAVTASAAEDRKTPDFARFLSAAGHRKIASDLGKFPVHRDGTVDVIIQFNQPLKPRHYQDMADRGGKLRFSLHHISGAAYRVPVAMLAWLEKHPDVAYVSPDRPNKAAFDDPIPAVMADLARQQYGSWIGDRNCCHRQRRLRPR